MRKKIHSLTICLYFAVATFLIIMLFPREGKFKYAFVEGRPWKYGLITAPFDFPIYKSDTEFKKEENEALKSYLPYFKGNDSILQMQLDQLAGDFRMLPDVEMANEYYPFLKKILDDIYKKGIVSIDDYTFLQEEGYNDFMIVRNNVAVKSKISDVYTIRSAYSYILSNYPDGMDENVLRSVDVDKYLVENIKYDPLTSKKVKEDLMSKVSPAIGMVQAGQKVIDRGEIVDSKTFLILNSLKKIYDSGREVSKGRDWTFVSAVLLVSILMLCFLLYLYFFRSQIFQNRKNVIFLLGLITVFTVLTEIVVRYAFFKVNVYVIPYAIIPIVICTFFDSRTARMTHNITILICSFMVSFPFEFIILQFVAGMVVVYSLKDLTNRFQLVRSSVLVLVTYIIIYSVFIVYQEGDWTKIDWKMFISFGINFIFLMFTYALIYIIERIFGYTSSVSLVELSDINSPLLRSLSENCPGTFQHSLQISVLGSAAASRIGANPMLVRTGALYHDIGKMNNPAYFTENQAGNVNPHNYLSYEKSAEIIINHVKEGVVIAEKNNLPKVIIDFIRTHHGKGKTKFFYNSFRNEFPDLPVDDSKFTYPGPNPFSKETAILMMADSVEASSRSLEDFTEEGITLLVNKIIDTQIKDGLLKNSPITFRDVETVKSVFIEKLVTMYHPRISYPDLKQEKE